MRKNKQMSNQKQPNWQPISALPLLTYAVEGMLSSAQEQYPLLQQAQTRPQILDQATVERVIKSYTEQKDDLWLYEEQLRRWKMEQLTTTQKQEISYLENQVEQLGELLPQILTLAEELKKGTIETILAKSDLELGLDFFRGKFD
jgi:hypothetical protein